MCAYLLVALSRRGEHTDSDLEEQTRIRFIMRCAEHERCFGSSTVAFRGLEHLLGIR